MPVALLLVFMVTAIFTIYKPQPKGEVGALLGSISSKDEWERGEFYPGSFDTVSTPGDLKLKVGAGGVWDAGTPGFPTDIAGYDYVANDVVSYGGDLATDGTYVYMIVGNRRPYLFRYNPELNVWKQLTNAPTAFYYGASLTYDNNGSLYAIDGGEAVETGSATRHMFKYSIATDTWSRVADAPLNWGLGASIKSDNNGKIYALRGFGTDVLWMYNPSNNTWDESLPALPAGLTISTNNSQPLLFVNEPYGVPEKCTLGCLFALVGGNSRTFMRYDISEKQWYYNSPADLTIPVALGGASYGSSMSYDSVNGNLYLLHGVATDNFSKYDVSEQAWDVAEATTMDTPSIVSYGSSSVYVNGYIYALKGNSPDFWRFDPNAGSTGMWNSISTPLVTGNNGENNLTVFVANNGTYCTDSEGCLYVLRGANSTTFWKLTLSNRTWTALSSVNLANVEEGGSMCRSGDLLYVIRGNVTNNFYSYDMAAGGNWTALTDVTSDHPGPADYPAAAQTVTYGGGIACLGSDVYVIKGAANANGSNHFFKYSGGSWSAMPVVPGRVYVGSAMAAVPNGSDCADASGCVFVMPGNLRTDFYRFNVGDQTWTTLNNIPTAPNHDASFGYDSNGGIYATVGDYNQRMYRYSIGSDTWSRTVDTPARMVYGNDFAYSSGTSTFYVMHGFGVSEIFKFTATPNSYVAHSSWISDPFDGVYVTGWNQLTATHPTAGSSSISFYLRSSTDKANWSSWETIVNNSSAESSTIDLSSATTPARRYYQVKIKLTSDGTNTPVVSDFSISVFGDGTAPTNPSVSGFSDSGMATPIVSGNSYYHINPYFTWTAPVQTESAISGYYVYFGDQASFDPTASENYFQTSTNYMVNSNLSGGTTYYLRIGTKDAAGNKSTPTTAFTYSYNGITTASSKTWTAQADFELGSDTGVNTTANGGADMSLDGVANGVWLDLPAAFGTALNGTAYNDTAMVFDGADTAYVLRSVNSKNFLKYSISTKTWSSLANIGSVANANQGSTLSYVTGVENCRDNPADVTGTTMCVYALVGNNSNQFQRYDIDGTDANTWRARSNILNTVGYGSHLVWGRGDFLYAARGNNSADYYYYSIAADTWNVRATPDYAFNNGGAGIFVPNGTYCADSLGCVFALRGAGSNHFWRYDISANSWVYRTAFASASPAKTNYGAALLYIDGYIYAIGGYASTDFIKYDILADTWLQLADLPATRYYGSDKSMIYDPATARIYVLRGYNEYSFLSYDVTSNKWLNPTMPHGLSSNGFYQSGLAYDGSDTLYVARGGSNSDFYSYKISTQAWTRLANTPERFAAGSDLLHVNGEVYALSGTAQYGDTSTRFFKYTPSTDTWMRLPDTPLAVGQGATLVWDGLNTIYTPRGANTTTVFAYTIGGTWATQASVVPGAVNDGACVVRDGSYLYLVRSSNTNAIYRCTLDTGAGTCTWSTAGTLSTIPTGTANQGSACAISDGNIYVPRGPLTTNDFLVYDIDGTGGSGLGSWSTRVLNNPYSYGRMVTGPNGIIYGFRGNNTSTMDRYVLPSSSTAFVNGGVWTSDIVTMNDLYDISGLEIVDTTPANTTLKYETRTCSNVACESDANDINWSGWSEPNLRKTDGTTDWYNVASTVAKYLQVRVTFGTDQQFSPSVQSITLRYYSDATAPSNPTTLDPRSQNGGSVLTTGNWYNYAAPYFSWGGAADNAGGIGIAGYYVYFGTNAGADPVNDGAFQTGATYTASNLSTTQSYYLKIKTKDHAGNTNASVWEPFIYRYDNVAPSRPTNITAIPAVPTATNSFTLTWTAGSDSGGSPYFEYCYMRYFNGALYDPSETCIPSTQLAVTGLEALAEGVNTFRVRAKDAAGNYSNSGEWESVQYRYAVTPPTLPASVQHGDVIGDPYSHTFSWNEPTSHAFDITAYCYQINEEPNPTLCNNSTYGRWTSTSETSGRFLAAFRTPNTQPGTNYFYIVARDEAGNVDWDASYDCDNQIGCIAFTSNTVTPNTPQGLSLTDASDRLSSKYRITLAWTKPADNPGSVLGSYKVYRSTDGSSYSLLQSLQHVDGQDEFAYTDVALSNAITYYYKVSAVDLAGAESDFTPALSMQPEGKFTQAPDLIGTPSITPRIRSAVISWLTDSPDTHPASSFVQFGTTPSLGSELGTSELTGTHVVTLTDLLPNTLYYIKLKWVDQDSNIGYSPNYTFTTNGAPSAPTGLTVDPALGSTNSFTFDWDPPVDEGVNISGYYYSINSVPTAENTIFVTDSKIGPIPAANKQGTNVFYVIAVDDVGNKSFLNYISITFSVQTPTPVTPKTITITDSSNRAESDYALTLRWSKVEGISKYSVYQSKDGGVTYGLIASTETAAYLDSGLDTRITYYYKVNAEDNAGAVSGFTPVVSKQPTGRFIVPPTYTSEPELTISSSTALVKWTTDRPSSSFVLYGKTNSLGQSTGSLTETLIHEVTLTGLDPSTNYFYRLQSFDEARDYTLEEAQSKEYSFSTSVAPAISDVKIEDVRQTSAIVTWTTTTVSSSVVKYGKTNDYGLEVNDESTGATTKHIVRLTNLDPESLYHVRIFGTDIDGSSLQSDDYVFQTLAFPRIFNVQFQPVEGASSATIQVVWETNVETDTVIEFAPVGEAFEEKAISALTKEHDITISDLLDNTGYVVRAKGRDQYGNVAQSQSFDYSTPFDTRPPKISDIVIETTILGIGKEATAQVVVSWKTDENSTSQIEYGEGVGGSTYANKTVEDAALTNSHVVIISDLTPSKPYHLRVVTRDGAGNTTNSEDYAVITGRATDSVFDLIVVNLQQTFGWLGGLFSFLGQ